MDQQYPNMPPMPPVPPAPQAPSTPPAPPAPPAPSKSWTWKEVLTLIFLILSPLIGMILMWVIAGWSKKAKTIITLVFLIPLMAILTLITLVSLGGARGAARDAVRQANMRQIVTAQEMYFGINNQYYQSINYPASIPGVMAETPKDPSVKSSYGWINNMNDGQKFCAYADLEKGDFYAASNKGNGRIAGEPLSLSDCENISSITY